MNSVCSVTLEQSRHSNDFPVKGKKPNFSQHKAQMSRLPVESIETLRLMLRRRSLRRLIRKTKEIKKQLIAWWREKELANVNELMSYMAQNKLRQERSVDKCTRYLWRARVALRIKGELEIKRTNVHLHRISSGSRFQGNTSESVCVPQNHKAKRMNYQREIESAARLFVSAWAKCASIEWRQAWFLGALDQLLSGTRSSERVRPGSI